MDLLKLSLSLLCVFGFTMLPFSLAHNSPQDFVNAHNDARAQVGVGPVKWSENMAKDSQKNAKERSKDCNLEPSKGPYGENLAWGSHDLTAANAVKLWVDEKKFYNYTTNSCAPGKMCGHYTQVVWKESVRIGCAKDWCKTGRALIVCNYDPPGNVVGQKPY